MCTNDEFSKKYLPKMVVVGPPDVGKSTLCNYLANMGVRCNRTPLLVDLDCGQNSIGVPGTIGTVMVERPSNPETGKFERYGSLLLHYGHTTPTVNTKLYCALVQRMADVVAAKQNSDQKVNEAGCIINTCGWMGDSALRKIVKGYFFF